MHEDTLSQIPIFSGLTKKELQELSANGREREYPAGETLVRQGETGVGLFVVLSGKVRVVQRTDGSGERELGVFGPGAALGELALLDDQPRSATIIATEPTKALIIPVWDFRAALRENPEISLKLLAVVSQRLRKVESHV